jgi:hypothetical protein
MGQVFGFTYYIENVYYPLLCVSISIFKSKCRPKCGLECRPECRPECGLECRPKPIQTPLLFRLPMASFYYFFTCVKSQVKKYLASLFEKQTCVVNFQGGSEYKDNGHQIQYKYICKQFKETPCSLCLDHKILNTVTKLVKSFYSRHNYTLEVTIGMEGDELNINVLLIFNGAYFTAADKSVEAYNESVVFVSKFNRALATSGILGKLPNFTQFCHSNYIEWHKPGRVYIFNILNI